MLASLAGRIARDAVTSRAQAYEHLRHHGLSAFGEAMFGLSEVPAGYDQYLPRMASEETQRAWTGNSGLPLLQHTVDFVRALMTAHEAFAGKSPKNARVLDYGCGYGRIARLCYFFTDPENVFGVDPWDESIRHCREAGLGAQFLQSDYVPKVLPLTGTFDLIYAFSVFTHLSEKTAARVLATLRHYIRPKGLLCVTIYPREYWSIVPGFLPGTDPARYTAQHDKTGFAFLAHDRPPIDGDVTFGETTMNVDWLATHAPDWKIVGFDYALSDPFQQYVFMRPS
jgi:SAM-dependent methyltransferase